MVRNFARLAVLATLGAMLPAVARAEDGDVYPIGPDQLAFSIKNMDMSVDPGVDFQRYAAGGWLDRAVRPERLASIGAMVYMQERANAILKAAVAQAGKEAATAPKGSPTQQVGDFYNAFMDIDVRNAAGLEPLRGELDKIAALQTPEDISAYLGEWALVVGKTPLFAISIATDFADASKYAVVALDGQFGLLLDSVYGMPEDSPPKQAYKQFVEDFLLAAGYDTDRARKAASMIVALETTLHSGKLSPAEFGDPRKRNNPMSFAEFQAQAPEIDMSLYLKAQGLPAPETILVYQPNYFPKLSQVLRDYSMEDLKDYLTFSVIGAMQGNLGTGFQEPLRKLTEALIGVSVQTPNDELVLQALPQNLGHPLGQVFVQSAFTEETRETALDMVERIKAVFRERIETRGWLSDETHVAALEKLDAFYYKVGYPDHWIDYGAVEVMPDNPVANVINLSTFTSKRDLARYGGPMVHDEFNNPRGTLPTQINAGYTPSINGFEVTAAIIQPAAFDPRMDPAVNYCRLGAVIGHEMTHGFDSGGRFYDSRGNLRNWWTDADSAAFEAEAKKLIDQANATEFLPGKFVDGALTVKENMADVGGITFAHLALMHYLDEHPEENVEIDGLTPSQRCFISWAQFWTEKSTLQFMENSLTYDHAPSPYRAIAPLRHVDAFYEAFDIREGDPMWLPPEQRVNAW